MTVSTPLFPMHHADFMRPTSLGRTARSGVRQSRWLVSLYAVVVSVLLAGCGDGRSAEVDQERRYWLEVLSEHEQETEEVPWGSEVYGPIFDDLDRYTESEAYRRLPRTVENIQDPSQAEAVDRIPQTLLERIDALPRGGEVRWRDLDPEDRWWEFELRDSGPFLSRMKALTWICYARALAAFSEGACAEAMNHVHDGVSIARHMRQYKRHDWFLAGHGAESRFWELVLEHESCIAREEIDRDVVKDDNLTAAYRQMLAADMLRLLDHAQDTGEIPAEQLLCVGEAARVHLAGGDAHDGLTPECETAILPASVAPYLNAVQDSLRKLRELQEQVLRERGRTGVE